jgi:lactoylglutathione lyase
LGAVLSCVPLQHKAARVYVNIGHIAIWTNNLEKLRSFYEKYFSVTTGKKYVNTRKQFESYFLSFSSGARLELMQTRGLQESQNNADIRFTGYAHIAVSLGSKEQVDLLTAQLESDGYTIVDKPRYTGDGYYESCVLDPDGNRIEVTV